jgi:hypothetical protein
VGKGKGSMSFWDAFTPWMIGTFIGIVVSRLFIEPYIKREKVQ